jgi:ABC-type Zn uptake system ZnuABC Zn-binding protein ZnuA
VVTTTTVLADLARNVGGELVEVISIVPPGADVHTFRSTPSHSITIGQAKLVVSNGSGLDDSFDPLLDSSKQASAVRVVASEGLDAAAPEELEFPGEGRHEEVKESDLIEQADQIIHQSEEEKIPPHEVLAQIAQLRSSHQGKGNALAGREPGDEEESLEQRLMDLVHEVEAGRMTPESAMEAIEELIKQHQGDTHQAEDEHNHEHGGGDPHFWLDPILAVHYVERIRNGLMDADPANAEIYERNAAEYTQKLQDLDQEIAQTLSQVPPERRHLVTFHDAFGHFGRRYGWEVSALVPSDASDVTPGAVVQVMERIQEDGIPAVFAEPQLRSDVLEQAARDTGVRVGTIYSDTIDDIAPTYIEMMRFNARSLADNLR